MPPLIALEGGEGAGKTTQTAHLKQWLTDLGKPVITARDPGSTDLGLQLRNILLNEEIYPNITEIEQLTLFGAAKVALSREIILPARESDSWLILDRFNLGSLVYQGYTSKVAGIREFAEQYTYLLLQNFWPDLTIVLDIPPEIGLNRYNREWKDGTRFENFGRPYHHKVREGYQHYAKAYANRGVILVDGNRSEQEVLSELKGHITARFLQAA